MNTGAKIATAVVGGYVLGRRKKAKLAITMGAWLIGKNLKLDPKNLVTEVTRQLTSSPQLSGLRDQVRDEMLTAGKTMATAIVARQVGKMTSSLQDRTESLLHPEEGVEKGKETVEKASKGLRGRFTRRGRGEDAESAKEETSEEFDEAAEDESDAAYAEETQDGAEPADVEEDRGQEDEREARETSRRRPPGARRPATTGRSPHRAVPPSSETTPARRRVPRESSGRSQPASRATTSSARKPAGTGTSGHDGARSGSTSARNPSDFGKSTSTRTSGGSTSARRSGTSQSGGSAKRGTTAERR
jgi:hypothetical protein